MTQSAPVEVFLSPPPAQSPAKRGGGPWQGGATPLVNKTGAGGPWQGNSPATVVIPNGAGPWQGNAPATTQGAQQGGPWQGNAPATIDATQQGGPWQGNVSPEVERVGNIEGRSDREHTQPGGMGFQVDGVPVSERDTANMESVPGFAWNVMDDPGNQRASVVPQIRGVVEIARVTLDLSVLGDTLVFTPTAPQQAGAIPHSVSLRMLTAPGAPAGTTTLSLGTNAPNYDSHVQATAVALGAVGDTQRLESLAGPFVLPAVGLYLRLAGVAEAAGFTVEAIVYGQVH